MARFKSELPKKGEGPEHLMAKQTGAGYIMIKYGYYYRFEYPVKLGDRRHTYDAVFYHPASVVKYLDKEVRVASLLNQSKFMREWSNAELMKLPYKKDLDKEILAVLEIDDYTKHTHKEQLINDGEAEQLAKDAFSPNVIIIRIKKEDMVEWQTKRELVTIQDSGKLIDDQCKGLAKTFLVK